MKLFTFSILFLIAAMSFFQLRAQTTDDKAFYEPTWESLDQHKCPEWYKDSKIGISVHWGVYSVPAWCPRPEDPNGTAYAEWYWRRLSRNDSLPNATQKYHKEKYGEDFDYDDFIPDFRAEKFDAARWMKFAKNAGAKYFFITSKHHDGFCLWDTKYTNRNAMKMGPKRDLLQELVDAARKEGLKIGFYYSLYEWNNPLYTGKGLRYDGLIKCDNYVDDFMYPQLIELIDKYHPDFLYLDGEWDHPDEFWRTKEIAAYYYNQALERNQEVFINDRYGKGSRGKHGDIFNVEYHHGKENTGLLDKKWSYWRGIERTFGYNRDARLEECMSPMETIQMMVDGVARNGNFDINIGPMASGIIPAYEKYPLSQMGDWLKVNGEAIYNTRPYTIQQEGDIRFTTNGKYVYAIFFKWPGKKFTIKSIQPAEGSKIVMLGVDKSLDWSYDKERGLTIYYPDSLELPTKCSYAWVFRIEES